MGIEHISKPEEAISEVKDELLRVEQSIAQFSMENAMESVRKIEQLASFLFTYAERAKKKKKDALPLTHVDNQLLAINFERLMKINIPALKNRIERRYQELNIYDKVIQNVKNIQQRHCMDAYWNVVKSLKFGMPEQREAELSKTLFGRVSIK